MFNRLKTQNQEEELMKLAKQFDKNMEELDVIQEQNKRNYDFTQMISETEILSNHKDNTQMRSLHNIVPEIDNATKRSQSKETPRYLWQIIKIAVRSHLTKLLKQPLMLFLMVLLRNVADS